MTFVPAAFGTGPTTFFAPGIGSESLFTSTYFVFVSAHVVGLNIISSAWNTW